MNCTCGHREESHWIVCDGDRPCLVDLYGDNEVCLCTNFTNTSLVDNS